MYEPGHNDDFYKKAKKEMAELYPKRPQQQTHRVWIPPHRTASGVRFGYWRREE